MTDPAALTDEELRALTQLTDHFPDERIEGWRVKMVIAALRASRAEVKGLTQWSDAMSTALYEAGCDVPPYPNPSEGRA